MKNSKIIIHLLPVLLLFSFVVCASPSPLLAPLNLPPPITTPLYVEGEFIVKYKPGVSKASRDDFARNLGVAYRKRLDKFGDIEKITMPNGRTVANNIGYIRSNSAVDMVEPNYISHVSEVYPNDGGYGLLWALSSRDNDVDIDAPQAWAFWQGDKSVVVGVIDTGINYTHPDLIDNLWINPGELEDGIDNDGNGYVDDFIGIDATGTYGANEPWDDFGHGTHVSGIVGAVGNNAIGVVGVNWGVSLAECKAGDLNGEFTDAAILECMEYFRNLKLYHGVNVVVTNHSYGGYGYSSIVKSYVDSFQNLGIIMTVAAGNDGLNNDVYPTYPASYNNANIVSVAALDLDGNLASFSNYGANNVDIAAPGVGIHSTCYHGDYCYMQGTSMAAPQVAGILAYFKSSNKYLSVSELLSKIYASPKVMPSLFSTTLRKSIPTMMIDYDADGMPDVYEDRFSILSWKKNDSSLDPDKDGLTNYQEYVGKTYPNDPDTDDDGCSDKIDIFPLNTLECLDTDSDGTGNNADGDDDNDGVDDVNDAFPLNPSESLDTDFDGIGNNLDKDDDGDGVADVSDAFPLNRAETADADNDGNGDNADEDDDNDSILDFFDNCKYSVNPTQEDNDKDNLGDICDADDDNDGVTDSDEVILGTDPYNEDSDGDGFNDRIDYFPLDASESVDTDKDGVGNNFDSDDDNDSVVDTSDNCPLMPNANQLDWDADGNGDKCDTPVPMPGDIASTIGKDGAGKFVAFAGDFNKDGYGDYVIGIPGFDALAKDAGRAEVISGKDGAVLASSNGTAAKDSLGTAVAGGGDIDNDGFSDVVVGAPNAGAIHAGSITILYGPDGTRTQNISGTVAKTSFGSALALGDVNGDSRADILVGAPKDDDAVHKLVDSGSVEVISGNDFSTLKIFYGRTAKANAGTSVASGDTNNDGNADIIIGAPNDGGTGSIVVYNMVGTELMKKSSETAKAQFGKSVASGDVNKDGFADVLVGSPGDDNGGLKDVGSVTAFSGNRGAVLVKKYGATAKASLGNSVAAGDVNGDGKVDLIAGAWKDDKPGTKTKDAGSVSVFSGNGYAQIGATRYGDVAKDYFGAAVSAGDINSDGKDDLIIGIPGFDVSAVKPINDAGKVTVLSGAGL